ncbi:MAG TPA: SRPBCC family protein, partial [Leptospiraceae bacterium]|nr:SRPBCC family protein [Leptospiraceae bacterium]
MRKLFAYILGTVMSIMVVFFVVGLVAPKEYTGSKTAQISAPPSRVWAVLTDIDSLPKNRPEIARVEVLEKDGPRAKKWIEHTDMDG